ncbi:MAG: formate dehydrogenase accessory sulfurtransferase FdhD [Gammaproteobacteria bacterium]|nr:formate dehydrogenase accessory sulfurtransferase FdhD [Gammaproteobacteria bacterium]
MKGASTAVDISKIRGAQETRFEDSVAVEEPLELQICSPTATGSAAKSISITMRTPGDDIDLALGFLAGEAIIADASEVLSAEHCGEADPETGFRNTVRVELHPDTRFDFDRLKRHFYTTSSCGVCGKSSIEALRINTHPAIDSAFCICREKLLELPGKLRAHQAVFDRTGGLHAAAAFDSQGDIIVAREDVGRHNAVDKVIGSLLRDGRLPAGDLGILVSGRASFELVQKAWVAGMPLLAAVSAPSSLAVRLAQESAMTLVGFLRDPGFNIYTGAQRIVEKK